MIMVTTADFPQADRLEQVGKVALAISKGHRADDDIESFIGLDSAGRQGRYYRHAAEVLGLISNEHNYSVLTPLGQEYASLTSAPDRMDFLARCLVETPVFREALRYIHKHKPSDSQLKQWFLTFYPGAKNTANRRFNTFISYLRDAGLLQQTANTNRLQKFSGSVVNQTVPPSGGLTGCRFKKPPSASFIPSSAEVIRVDIDAQKLDRANWTHWQLVDAKSSFLDARGLEPYTNPYIDLFTEDNGDVILYEMKSVDPTGANLLSQMRKAVSQLYEYRYIYKIPKARLCIVTNHGIAKKDDWLLDYLAKDRSIAYEWTNDFANFESHYDAKSLLGNFAP